MVKNEEKMLKYIPSKQVTFTLFAIYDKKNDNYMNKGKIVKGKVTSSKIQKNPNKVNNLPSNGFNFKNTKSMNFPNC